MIRTPDEFAGLRRLPGHLGPALFSGDLEGGGENQGGVETELPIGCILSFPIMPGNIGKVLEYQGVTTGTQVAKLKLLM
jgi:hypothetical protein